jgi:hypothetical protein
MVVIAIQKYDKKEEIYDTGSFTGTAISLSIVICAW